MNTEKKIPLRKCRDELFALVKDVYYKADLDRYQKEAPVELWLWGSVLLKNKIIAPELTDLLKKEFPSIQIRIPEKTALDTALDIAKSYRKAAGQPDYRLPCGIIMSYNQISTK